MCIFMLKILMRPSSFFRLDEEIADVNKDKTFMEKVVQITESFGSEKKKRAVVTIQRNRLDSSMLNETIVPAIQHAENQSKSEAGLYTTLDFIGHVTTV